MKSKLKMRTPAVLLTLIAALTMVSAMAARAADNKSVVNPPAATGSSAAENEVFRRRYGLDRVPVAPPPVNPGTPLPTPSGGIDPNTGLPVPPSVQWKDPNWKDPEKVLPEVSYDALPLSEVCIDLRDKFKNAFDVLIPNRWQDPGDPDRSFDPRSALIKMQLKNVAASEVFNAMNLVFEIENTPLRWELTMNGKRPTAVLRVLTALVSNYVRQPPEPTQRMIYFVGELLGDEKSGGMTMEQLVKTISEVYEMSYSTSQGSISSHLQFHKQAQLLIVTGTVDQIRFVEQTIAALKQKAELASGIRRIPGVGSMLMEPVGGRSGGGSVQKGPEPKANAETKKTP